MDSTRLESSQRRTPPPAQKIAAAWLVFPYGKGMKSQAFHDICNRTTCRKSIPELSGKSFWQKTSHQNWLIIACTDKNQEIIYNNSYKWKYGECFLWNLVTLESIRLPNLQEWICKPEQYVLIDCVLTSAPSGHYPDDSAAIFLFSTPFNKKYDVLLLFCLPGDKQWKTKRISRRNIAGDFTGELISLHCLKGKLYVTFSSDDCLWEIEKEHLLDDNVKILPVRLLDLVMGNTRFSQIGADCFVSCYVQSHDEIFNIWLIYNRKCMQVISIEVWRLDLSSMKWEDMHDFGDHVIFLGMRTGFCCSEAKLGLTSGGLYYTLPNDQSLYRFQGNGSNAVISPCLQFQTPWFRSEWIMLMPEDGQKRMENDSEEEEEIEEQKEGNKTCTTSDTNESCDEQNKNEISPWDALNEDTVAAISNYLHPLDYVRYRSVCKANRRILPLSTQKLGSNSAGYPYISPWLMFPRDNNTYCFLDPLHDDETYLMSFCESVQGATIHYQKDGWLLMSREIEEVFFYNPFTREIIRLPDFPGGYNISIICFNDPPTTPDCVVVVIDQTEPMDTTILTIMRGDDIWLPRVVPHTYVDKELMTLHGTAATSYKGVFYCVNSDGTLGTRDLTKKEDSWSVLAIPKKIFNNDTRPNFLVVCGGDILLIKLGHLGTAVRVFRLDLSEMKWAKVESLGKYMLFISETSCLSAIAPDSKMENMICFSRVYLNGEGILLYSLETGSYHSSSGKNYQHSFNSFYETEGWLWNCTWIQPNWAKSTEQELDWFKMIQQ